MWGLSFSLHWVFVFLEPIRIYSLNMEGNRSGAMPLIQVSWKSAVDTLIYALQCDLINLEAHFDRLKTTRLSHIVATGRAGAFLHSKSELVESISALIIQWTPTVNTRPKSGLG